MLGAAAVAGVGGVIARPSRGRWFGTPAARRIGPGSLPHPHLPEGTDTLPQIDHIVVVMMENHSFDNYFGMLGRGDGFRLDKHGQPLNTNADATGKSIRAFHMPSTCQLDKEPNNSWNESHIAQDGGKNDGFVLGSGPVAMGYWTGDDLPFYYGLARTFPLADRWFASTAAKTFPNRRFLIAGTAHGHIVNNDINLDEPAPNGTIFDRLNQHGIEWRDYYTNLPTAGLYLNTLKPVMGEQLVKVDQYFTDAAKGTLPGFCLVEPDFKVASEENPQDIRIGEEFTSRHQCGDGRAGVAEDDGRALLRRARRVLRPRAVATRGPARRDPTQPPTDGSAGRLRPLRRAGPGGHRLAPGASPPRLAHGVRPHLDPQARRDEVEPPGNHQPRRPRGEPARLPRSARPTGVP